MAAVLLLRTQRSAGTGALKAWAGKAENVEAAQRAYYHRAKMNSAARTGVYAPEMEQEAVSGWDRSLAATQRGGSPGPLLLWRV